MKDTKKMKITRNYHLLRRVESWKWSRVTAFICPNCSGIQTNARNMSLKKTIFLLPEIVKWNSFMLFLLMKMDSALAGLQALWIWAACISLHTFQRTLRASACRDQRIPKEGDEVGEQRHASGDIGWYPIPKCRAKNRRNIDTAYIFGHAYLKLDPSRVFVYIISSVYAPAINLSHWEETWDDLELIGTTIEKDALRISS